MNQTESAQNVGWKKKHKTSNVFDGCFIFFICPAMCGTYASSPCVGDAVDVDRKLVQKMSQVGPQVFVRNHD